MRGLVGDPNQWVQNVEPLVGYMGTQPKREASLLSVAYDEIDETVIAYFNIKFKNDGRWRGLCIKVIW